MESQTPFWSCDRQDIDGSSYIHEGIEYITLRAKSAKMVDRILYVANGGNRESLVDWLLQQADRHGNTQLDWRLCGLQIEPIPGTGHLGIKIELRQPGAALEDFLSWALDGAVEAFLFLPKDNEHGGLTVEVHRMSNPIITSYTLSKRSLNGLAGQRPNHHDHDTGREGPAPVVS